MKSDSIIVSRNMSLYQVQSSIPSISITPQILSLQNYSIVKFTFNRDLLPSEMLDVTLTFRQKIEFGFSQLSFDYWWNYTRIVGYHQIGLLIFKGIAVTHVSPNPEITMTTPDDFLLFKWNEVVPQGFNGSILASVSDVAMNSIIAEPSSFTLVIQSKTASVSMEIGNVALTPVKVAIAGQEWITPIPKNFTITPLSKAIVSLNFNFEKSGIYQTNLLIMTNRTKIPITVSISINVKINESPSPFPYLLTLIFVILLVAVAISWKMDIIRKIATQRLFSHTDTKSLPQFSDLRLDTRQKQILEIIESRPGCSQQLVAEHLGLSKATASREITKLANLGIIEKRRNGMSYELYLKGKQI